MQRLTLFFVLILSGFASGAEKKQPQIRFLAERVPKDLGEVCLVADDKQSESFTLPTNYLSERLKAPSRSFRVMTRSGGGVCLATIQLPENGADFIAILVPSTTGYRAILMPSANPTFKGGDVYFYNHCPNTVVGYVGTAKFGIEPASGKVIQPAGARVEKFYDVAFGVREDRENRVLSRTRWPVDDRSRSYVFFFVNPTTGRIDYRAVDEFTPPSDVVKSANSN
ncbi:MAG: hypothetical protein KC587_18040 [Nitrospira sp.]|nr:hypothetical protein [Nitrospira sp.]